MVKSADWFKNGPSRNKWFRHSRLQICVFSGLVIGWWSKLWARHPYPTQISVPPLPQAWSHMLTKYSSTYDFSFHRILWLKPVLATKDAIAWVVVTKVTNSTETSSTLVAKFGSASWACHMITTWWSLDENLWDYSSNTFSISKFLFLFFLPSFIYSPMISLTKVNLDKCKSHFPQGLHHRDPWFLTLFLQRGVVAIPPVGNFMVTEGHSETVFQLSNTSIT